MQIPKCMNTFLPLVLKKILNRRIPTARESAVVCVWMPTGISPRQSAEISRLIAGGYPNKTIAAVLQISSWTVPTHLRRIFAKLGVSSPCAMVARMMGSVKGSGVSHIDSIRRAGCIDRTSSYLNSVTISFQHRCAGNRESERSSERPQRGGSPGNPSPPNVRFSSSRAITSHEEIFREMLYERKG